MKVKVYFNLRKKCFSVQHKGLVVAHTDKISLKDVVFSVSEAGRQRVLREKRKNVHAYVIGFIDKFQPLKGSEITYNPYKWANFVKKRGKKPVFQARFAQLTCENEKGKIIAL